MYLTKKGDNGAGESFRRNQRRAHPGGAARGARQVPRQKGAVTGRLKNLGSLPPEGRKEAGKAINVLKKTLEEAVEARREALERDALNRKLEGESLDVTLPGTGRGAGGLHLLTRVTNRLTDVFRGMGYDVVVGPELEDEFHNFDALNTPDWHPARDLQDTFWTTDGRLLRTHTSPMQVRYMETHKPPFKVVVPGKNIPQRGGRRHARDAVSPARGARRGRARHDGRP